MEQLLEGKTAIIYGGGGGIGGGVARTFAREGASVFLAGRTRSKLDAVASDIKSAGGSAEVAELDALDERAVDGHIQNVVAKTGRVDISFNLITRGDAQGTPLVEMETDDLLRAVVNGLRSSFITARAAARRRHPDAGKAWSCQRERAGRRACEGAARGHDRLAPQRHTGERRRGGSFPRVRPSGWHHRHDDERDRRARAEVTEAGLVRDLPA